MSSSSLYFEDDYNKYHTKIRMFKFYIVLGHEGFSNTICEVVMQGREQGACQFSWWCDGRSDDAEEDKSYAIAKEIARKALNRQLTDRTGGALYFHQRKVTPNWSNEYIRTVEVGEHVFYKPHGGVAK